MVLLALKHESMPPPACLPQQQQLGPSAQNVQSLTPNATGGAHCSCIPPCFAQGDPGAKGAAAGRPTDAAAAQQQEQDEAAAVQLAAQVLHAIVVQHRGLVRSALRNMPPLPSLYVLTEVNAVLIQVMWEACC